VLRILRFSHRRLTDIQLMLKRSDMSLQLAQRLSRLTELTTQVTSVFFRQAQLFLCPNQFFLQAHVVSFVGLHIFNAFGFHLAHPLDQLRQRRPLFLGNFGLLVTNSGHREQASS
jgi:hypothetical protein